MELPTLFIFYLIMYRLAIIGAGIVSMILGYLLFKHGYGKSNQTELEGSIKKIRIFIRNAAPGTCYALFGAIIITVMLVTGRPEMALKSVASSKLLESGSPESTIYSSHEFTIRGNYEYSDLIKQAKELEKQQKIVPAIENYEKALDVLAEPMNNLAWLYLKQNQPEKARPLSRMAVELSGDNPEYLDTLAEVFLAAGDSTQALNAIEKAAKIDAKFQTKYAAFRKKIKNQVER